MVRGPLDNAFIKWIVFRCQLSGVPYGCVVFWQISSIQINKFSQKTIQLFIPQLCPIFYPTKMTLYIWKILYWNTLFLSSWAWAWPCIKKVTSKLEQKSSSPISQYSKVSIQEMTPPPKDTVYAEILAGRIFGVFTVRMYLAELNLATCDLKKMLIQTVTGNYYEIWINHILTDVFLWI